MEKLAFFQPYLYVPAASKTNCDAFGIDNTPLIKKTFRNEWEREKYADSHKGRLYFKLPAAQQYLLEQYYNSDIQDLTKNKLKTFFIDIEVIASEFPDPKEAKFPITSIAIYDNISEKYYVWGIKPFNEYTCKDHLTDIEPDEIVYENCKDEKELMKKFLRFWRSDFPDVLVGYNSYSFDFPYIVNRIEQIFGEGKSAKLSPVDNIFGIEKENRFGHKYTEYTIGGISHIDYMVLFKYLTPGERESDALDYVCEEELGIGKLDYGNQSLQELCHSNWDKFINYNIWDVKLMVMLDAKRKYLDIAKFSAFSGFCNIDKVLGKVSIITGVLAKQGMLENKMIPAQKKNTGIAHERIPGGYVKTPDPGLYRNCISFDANSLYPNTIITLNISPESKRGKIINTTPDSYTVHLFLERHNIEIQKTEMRQFLIDKGWSLSAAGIMFDQKEQAICAKFVDNLYKKRVVIQRSITEIESEMVLLNKNTNVYKAKKVTLDQLDTEQYLIKILLNSTYGALACAYFDLYDLDCAKSITMTGQAMIKEAEKINNKFIQDEWNLPEKERGIAADTDSNFFDLTDLVNSFKEPYIDADGNLSEEFVKAETKIKNNLNNKIHEWAEHKLNSKDCRFKFGREAIATTAIWAGKKHYVMHIRNMKGIKTDNIKYKGLALVKATFSKETKNISKNIVKGILTTPNKKEANEKFFESFEVFKNFALSVISERSSIKVLDDYSRKSNGFQTVKACPRHVKYSLYHNHLLEMLGLDKKYPKIENGKKIKIIYVKPNKYNIDGIAYLDVLPPEFDLEVDTERMFEKCIINCLKPIYAALQWEIPNVKLQYENSLLEIKRRDQSLFEHRDIILIGTDYYNNKWISKNELKQLFLYEKQQLMIAVNTANENYKLLMENFNIGVIKNYQERS
jgi:DNA polymerase elongation subunit (family B)